MSQLCRLQDGKTKMYAYTSSMSNQEVGITETSLNFNVLHFDKHRKSTITTMSF